MTVRVPSRLGILPMLHHTSLIGRAGPDMSNGDSPRGWAVEQPPSRRQFHNKRTELLVDVPSRSFISLPPHLPAGWVVGI